MTGHRRLIRSISLALMLAAPPAWAGPAAPPAPSGATAVLDEQAAAMRQLGLWSGLSVVSGAVMLLAPSAVVRDVGLQCLAWGVIDGGIALWAHADIARKRAQPIDPVAEREGFRRLLLINAGLDVAYVGLGAYLLTRPSLVGHGIGVGVQGGFLLLFDGYHAYRASQPLQAPSP